VNHWTIEKLHSTIATFVIEVGFTWFQVDNTGHFVVKMSGQNCNRLLDYQLMGKQFT